VLPAESGSVDKGEEGFQLGQLGQTLLGPGRRFILSRQKMREKVRETLCGFQGKLPIREHFFIFI
jgi:hypothetical protein